MTADPRQLIPPVPGILKDARIRQLTQTHGRQLIRLWVNDALDYLRTRLSTQTDGHAATDSSRQREALMQSIVRDVTQASTAFAASCPSECINATGILLHTGLGRAPLSARAVQALADAAGATPIEVDPESGLRAGRAQTVRDRLRAITHAEDALVVNNNAAATVLVLQALCEHTEVIISRGELVEIGGSFRLPDIFRLAGATLVEVGTTNRTRLDDYADAITPRTSAILRVHPANFRIQGFVESPSLSSLVELSRQAQILMLDDIGSGLLEAASEFSGDEPSFSDSLQAGADVVLASADKLLGGPQAGLIMGRRKLVRRIARHPLARAVRTGKLTLAALAATLDEYLLKPESPAIPLVQMMRATTQELTTRAQGIASQINQQCTIRCRVVETTAETGGGSLPAVAMGSVAVQLDVPRPDFVARRLRLAKHPVWSRIQSNQILLDLRSVLPAHDQQLQATVIEVLQQLPN